MWIRTLQVVLYIVHCFRLRARPWLFFQLNAAYFDDSKAIFSKLDIDCQIPCRWRLAQCQDTGIEIPSRFPVFVKPEWGQNSSGVCRVGSLQQLEQVRRSRVHNSVPYLIQEAAQGRREFEVFVVPEPAAGPASFAVLSITETLNCSEERLPVNGIANRDTSYRDRTAELSTEQQQQLWSHLCQVGDFRIARFGIRADSLEEMLQGRFKIFEVNLFIPMPLVLLADNVSLVDKLKAANHFTISYAQATRAIPANSRKKSIFFRKMWVHLRNRWAEHSATTTTYVPHASVEASDRSVA